MVSFIAGRVAHYSLYICIWVWDVYTINDGVCVCVWCIWYLWRWVSSPIHSAWFYLCLRGQILHMLCGFTLRMMLMLKGISVQRRLDFGVWEHKLQRERERERNLTQILCYKMYCIHPNYPWWAEERVVGKVEKLLSHCHCKWFFLFEAKNSSFFTLSLLLSCSPVRRCVSEIFQGGLYFILV
jgi:hypothetical protein